MPATQPKIPGPDHPITVQPSTERVVVSAGDHVIADTANALELHEASYPPVYYVPLADVDASVLTASETTSYCPYKGEASYYSIRTTDGLTEDAVWYYPEPQDAVAPIAGHVAFYVDRVSVDVGRPQ